MHGRSVFTLLDASAQERERTRNFNVFMLSRGTTTMTDSGRHVIFSHVSKTMELLVGNPCALSVTRTWRHPVPDHLQW